MPGNILGEGMRVSAPVMYNDSRPEESQLLAPIQARSRLGLATTIARLAAYG